MFTSFIDRATSYVNRAKKEAAKKVMQSIVLFQSAEELKKELQDLQDLKRAIDDVVNADIEAMQKIAKSDKEIIDQKIKQLCDSNSEFVEKALELMENAQKAVSPP